MSDNLSEDAEVKQLFVDESLEALQRVEELLLAAEQGRAPANMVDVMFRDMHTIKGTAGLLGYEKTASLAHAAEDLMSLLRDKTMKARQAHWALMVEVVDGLRQFVESTRDLNTEGALDCSRIVAELRRYAELGDAAPEPTPAAPPAAAAAPAPAPAEPAPAEAPKPAVE
ncbi:MAG: Hpt domain-containing protein, partial [Myxococcota bacterium]